MQIHQNIKAVNGQATVQRTAQQVACIPDNRPQTAIQKQQVTEMNNKHRVTYPVQLKKDDAGIPVANTVMQRHKAPVIQLLTKGQILLLPGAKKAQALGAFGPHTDSILDMVPSIPVLDQWIAEMIPILARVSAAKLKTDNPSLSAAQNAIDRAEYDAAIAARNGKIAVYLAVAAPAPAPAAAAAGAGAGAPAPPVWGKGVSVAKGVPAKAVPKPAAAAAAAAPAPAPQKLPALGTVVGNYHNHGNFTSTVAKNSLLKANLINYVKQNSAHFIHRPAGNDFIMELGDANDGSRWFITVTYSPAAQTATITHFGPFGVATAAAIAQAAP